MNKRTLFLIIVLLGTVASAGELPKIAVYVTGDIHFNEKNALGTRMLASLVNSGRYRGIERSSAFLAEVEREQVKQRSGDVDDSQISKLGKMFGVEYVCIAAIIPVYKSYQISARIVDVETAEVVSIGEAYSGLRVVEDFKRASDEAVKVMFNGQKSKPDKPETGIQAPGKTTFWIGIGFDVLSAGILAYGLYENENVKKHNKIEIFDNAEKAARNRNAAYMVSAAMLLSGITVHILF